MKKSIYNFSRVLGAFLLCVGLVLVGCTDDPLGGGDGSGDSTTPVSVSLGEITATTVQFHMTLDLKAIFQYDEAGLIFSSVDDLDISAETATIFQINRESYSKVFTGLTYSTKYYYTTYLKKGAFYLYGDKKEFTTTARIAPTGGYTNLSATETANCYIISQSGNYCFLTIKGNNPSEFLHLTESASVLWESFGTSTAPSVGDLIKSVSYKDGYIAFQTADVFKEGNAVIAAKDADGNILWSWHIWLTDQPQGQEYFNNAGTMMDRNLGATSATPGDVGALGLLYQWGRKDPFLGYSSISDAVVAKSTITWPSSVSTSSSHGTVSYVTANPTTFVYASSSPYDWHYSSRDNTLWTTSDKTKSIYDPCPSGWRVPDGGSNGVWSKAKGSSSEFDHTYSSSNEGMNFSGKFGSASVIWYPASGCRGYDDGGFGGVGSLGVCWSASPSNNDAYDLYFNILDYVNLSDDHRAYCYSVRCLQE